MALPYRRFFGFHYIMLRCLGLGWWHHPDEHDTRNFPGLYVIYAVVTEVVWVGGFVGLETIDPFIGEKDIDRFMFSLSFVVTHDLTCIKLFIFFFKNRDIQEIVRTLNVDLQQFYQNDAINQKTIRTSRKLTASFLFFGWMTIANSDAYGILQDLSWKAEVAALNGSAPRPPRALPQPIFIPWKYETEAAFVASFLLETVGLLWTGHIVMIIDTFVGSLILHMSAQFTILQEAFETAYRRTMEGLVERAARNGDHRMDVTDDGDRLDQYESIVRRLYSRHDIESALEETFRSCFRQHQMLVNCVERFAATYSYGFMTQLLSSMAAICVVMVQLSKDASSIKSVRLVTSLAFFAAMILQLALQCFTGNELTYQAGRVSEAVAGCGWERLPPRLRRLLLPAVARAQRPLRLSAGGFAHMDNACFLAIMKAAYSYYAVLSDKQK